VTFRAHHRRKGILAPARTVEFLKRAATLEGKPELAAEDRRTGQRPQLVPDTVRQPCGEGRGERRCRLLLRRVRRQERAGIIRFPASVNLSDTIQNAAGRPHTAKNPKEATEFVRFIPVGRRAGIFCWQTGQPPVGAAIRKGKIPPELTN